MTKGRRPYTGKANTASLAYLFAGIYDVTGFSLIGELIFIVCFPWQMEI